jgi:Tol biopolymer transport system component
MELLEGETLSARLVKGALSTEQVLRCGVEIADALDKAHRQGIVHRDLKPGNIMLTKSGVKLLDFGLAKWKGNATPAVLSGLSAMPTHATPMTAAGSVLGTFQYMAPEQLEGKEADGRSDVFALGAVLYEMASGRKAFEGKSQASLIAAILEHEPPPLASVVPTTPPALDRLVRNCLAKDPDDRIQTAHDVGLELKGISQSGPVSAPIAPVPRRMNREAIAWGVTVAALAVAAWLGLSRPRPAAATSPAKVLRTNVLLPEKVFLNCVTISPDGSRLAFSGIDESGKVSIWVRPLDSFTATPLAGTDGGILPFWSPDGRSLGFFADKKLKRVDTSGGAPIVLYEVDGLGGAWSVAGDILFTGPSGPVFRLPATGGKAVTVTKLDEKIRETAHRYPFFLPDGKHFLYTSLNLAGNSRDPANRIWVGSVDGSPGKPLAAANFNAQYADGYLLFLRGGDFGGNLLAQPMNLERLETTGEPVVVADQVALYGDFLGYGDYSVSTSGALVYDASQLSTRLEWFDRGGKRIGSFGEPATRFGVRISPDGSRVAFSQEDTGTQTSQIWIGDLARGIQTRLTSGPGSNSGPLWSPDGTRIAYQTDRKHQADVYVRSVSGAGSEQALTDLDGQRLPQDWSPDGKYILAADREAAGGRLQQLVALAADGSKPVMILPRSPNDFGSARFSPDGKWIVYEVDESGRREIYALSFPDAQRKVQISSNGGLAPKWVRKGKEIVYASFDRRVMSVEVEPGPDLKVGATRALFQVPEGVFGMDVTADGERFFAIVPVIKSSSVPLSVVVNWTAALKK